MGIQKLGHVGIYAQDFEKLRDFYSRVVGLTIADEAANACFMSSDPDREHHEFVIFRASGPEQKSCVQQISFSCEKLEDIVDYYHRFKDNDVRFRSVTSHSNAVGLYFFDPEDNVCEVNDVRFRSVTSHGNAVGLYFFDPEDNVCEVYWTTPWKAHQPYGVAVDLTQDLDEVKRLIQEDVAVYGETGHSDPESFKRQREQLTAAGIRL